MDKDYQNFVDRMGSFEDSIDLSGNDVQLHHNLVDAATVSAGSEFVNAYMAKPVTKITQDT